MNRNYFQMIDDVESLGRWFLEAPSDSKGHPVDPELFRVAHTVEATGPLKISVRKNGHPLSWTFADFDMPVADPVATKIIQDSASNLEIHPASIEKHNGQFAVINVLDCRKCLDESKSEFLKWTPADKRPDKIGRYRQITRLRIDVSATQGSDIFRLEGWKIALIVSDRIKQSFERNRITGVRFMPVS